MLSHMEKDLNLSNLHLICRRKKDGSKKKKIYQQDDMVKDGYTISNDGKKKKEVSMNQYN